MSAPDTNTEKEEQRHRPALLGIRASIIYAGILLLGLIVWLVVSGQDDTGEPGGDDTVPTVEEGMETEEALEGFEEETYEPGGNSTGSVSADSEGESGGSGTENENGGTQ
ncbi:hypothetical protein LVO79_04750 [Roseivivax marinus]|uniref:hypothetical protein n=1 Tax=Roseivivax marinus TaxID=1379903 RepID=UPI0008B5544C|nr:hypothetical protein [Roseivivax marinus]UMA65778.1 hypothetical protein LVO79_04750 [Roseivivax marinus]SEL17013.1 hypothetical protein SAMN05444413_106157 [Roseivivax marinus]